MSPLTNRLQQRNRIPFATKWYVGWDGDPQQNRTKSIKCIGHQYVMSSWNSLKTSGANCSAPTIVLSEVGGLLKYWSCRFPQIHPFRPNQTTPPLKSLENVTQNYQDWRGSHVWRCIWWHESVEHVCVSIEICAAFPIVFLALRASVHTDQIR